ncbi:hypothetical protein NL533_30740, partial [Klebsiella pneumoniae]|nr:hypothetical protein [Klebsiella pneumoniae]
MTGSFGTPVVAVSASVPVGGLPAGNHTLAVRGRDAAGNWGSPGQAVVYVPPADGVGPTASGLTVTPATVNPSAGATVSLSATIS